MYALDAIPAIHYFGAACNDHGCQGARIVGKTHTGGWSVRQSGIKKLDYDPSTSFEPICHLAATPIVLIV